VGAAVVDGAAVVVGALVGAVVVVEAATVAEGVVAHPWPSECAGLGDLDDPGL
jgi:hypothetical protein